LLRSDRDKLWNSGIFWALQRNFAALQGNSAAGFFDRISFFGGASAMSSEPTLEIEEHRFADDGVVPNNSRLPLIVYRGVLDTGLDAAAACERLFAGNGWSGGWRGGVYAYHHYHSTAHEALGIVAGSAKVRLGGDNGALVDLHAGDAVVIPAGVAHKGEAASPDLVIVGAYPGGHGPDLRVPGKGDREQALTNIAAVSLPANDPVCGRSGPLIDRWLAD
jgi:uncharacterized protein YjlB